MHASGVHGRTGRIVVVCNLVCWDTNWTDFKRKVGLQEVCLRTTVVKHCKRVRIEKGFVQYKWLYWLTYIYPLISMLTKDDWLLHLFIHSFHLFEFDWFLCRCSLATAIELQWSNIYFILAQDSLLEVFVSTPKLGTAMFQWEWRYMAVKMVSKLFFHIFFPWSFTEGNTPVTLCGELCQTVVNSKDRCPAVYSVFNR